MNNIKNILIDKVTCIIKEVLKKSGYWKILYIKGTLIIDTNNE